MRIRPTFFINIGIILFALAAPNLLSAQPDSGELEKWKESHIHLGKTSMLVLSGWALGNIAVGGYGNFNSEGQGKYFHQMNAAWNLVNLGIGTIAYYNYLQMDPTALSMSESIKEAHSIEKILMINIGLNIGYMATGAYLWERGRRTESSRLKGYGPSLILQGGFLLLFDSVLYSLHASNNSKLYELTEHLSVNGTQIGITFSF